MPSTLTWLRAAAIAAIATQATAQQCYYPGGGKAGEKPCSSAEGSACCPDKWQCLDNGLCYYPPTKLYGRYSCTDQSWKSPGCPSNLCTYDFKGSGAFGGESITQCSDHDNNWCCNANDQDVKCCQEWPEPRPFFALQDGKAYATVGSNTASEAPDLASITGIATSGGGSGGGGSGSRTSAPASSDAPSSTAGSSGPAATVDSITTSAKPFTSTKSSITTDATGGVKTVSVEVTITPTATPSPTDPATPGPSGGSSSKIGVIVGCAVGIPLALALVGIIFWLLRKRRNQKANPYKETPEMEGGNNAAFVGGAAGKLGKKQTFRHSGPATAEIDGNPVGAGQRVSAVKNHAELPSGNEFQPGQGTPYAPDAVGIGGGNGRETWGSVPPQYSPAHNQTAFAHHPDAAELDASGTGVLPVVNEKPEAQQQYIPYRPPHPVAEMPTVTTPPEDIEKQMNHR